MPPNACLVSAMLLKTKTLAALRDEHAIQLHAHIKLMCSKKMSQIWICTVRWLHCATRQKLIKQLAATSECNAMTQLATVTLMS